jgi:hypothetical protein
VSNRLFFAVPLVLMGVLSGCNSLPIQGFLGNDGNSKLRDEAPAYAKDVLVCRTNEFMPSKQAIEHAELVTPKILVPLGKDIGKALTSFAYNQNCDLVSKAYIACGEGFDRFDCIQGYVYRAISYDKKDIAKLVEDKKAEQAKAEAERQAVNNRQLEEQILAKQKAEKKAEEERKQQQTIAFNNALHSISNDDYGRKTVNIIKNLWDETSREEMRQNPTMVKDLYIDVRSGMYERVTTYAERLKNNDGAIKSNSLEYYKRAAIMLFKEAQEARQAHVEKLASNETQLDANIYWHISQINEKKLKLSKLKEGSAAYSEVAGEIAYLTKELSPLEEAKALIKQRENEAYNRKLAQEREYQNQQLQQQRQAQQAQVEYQRQQLEIQQQQLKQAQEAASDAEYDRLNNNLKSMRRTTCIRTGNFVNCY